MPITHLLHVLFVLGPIFIVPVYACILMHDVAEISHLQLLPRRNIENSAPRQVPGLFQRIKWSSPTRPKFGPIPSRPEGKRLPRCVRHPKYHQQVTASFGQVSSFSFFVLTYAPVLFEIYDSHARPVAQKQLVMAAAEMILVLGCYLVSQTSYLRSPANIRI